MGLTDQRKRAKDITDYQETSLLRLPTKRVKNYRIPTGKILTDHRHGLTLSIFVLEKRAFYIFFQGIRKYRKISKISPGAYIFQRPFLRGLFTEGNLRFKIDWASLQWEGNLPFLLCFTLYSRANSKYKPHGDLIFGGAI